MFSFLKDKMKSALSSLTKTFDQEAEVVETVEEKNLPETVQEKAKVILQEKTEKQKEEQSKNKHIPPLKEKELRSETKDFSLKVGLEKKGEEKKGFFAKVTEAVTTKKISGAQFDALIWDLEVELLENNVAFEVIEKIKMDLKAKLVDIPLKRGEVEKILLQSLKRSIEDVLDFETFDLIDRVKKKKDKPYVIVFIGQNGTGKTTSIAKIAHFLKKQNMTSVLAAADTFRSASIEQLEEHGKKVGMKVIKHTYGSDPAAVAFDSIAYSKQKGLDVVLIDTAGRQHSNTNLIEELKKIVRVAKPDLKIYIGEMISGNDCIEQITDFDKAIGIDGVILSKADIDEKGGTALSVSYVTKKPIYYLGVGQSLEDLQAFDKETFLRKLFTS